MSINIDRIERNILKLAKYSDKGKGITRISFTDTYSRGIKFVRELMEEAGLTTQIDSVGNLVGRLDGKNEGKKAILIGSHIDTVPNGGMFDGTVGVLGGIEVINTLKECGYENTHPIEVISFINEEGTAKGFPAMGTFGSRAMMGLLDINIYEKTHFKEANLTLKDIKLAYRNPATIKSYLELHIEQGSKLYDSKIPIGIVTGIVGVWKFKVSVKGKACHAGTTSMQDRDDALLKALPIIKGVSDIANNSRENVLGTVGIVEVMPGAANVVPGEVNIIIELRAFDVEKLNQAVSQINYLIKGVENAKITLIEAKSPSLMDEYIQSKIEIACKSKNIGYQYMESGAGHDARDLAKKVPSGLIFIPSKNGLSHVPEEFTDSKDIHNGLVVLIETLKLVDMELNTLNY